MDTWFIGNKIEKWRAIAKWIYNLAFILLNILVLDKNGQGIRKFKQVWVQVFCRILIQADRTSTHLS